MKHVLGQLPAQEMVVAHIKSVDEHACRRNQRGVLATQRSSADHCAHLLAAPLLEGASPLLVFVVHREGREPQHVRHDFGIILVLRVTRVVTTSGQGGQFLHTPI